MVYAVQDFETEVIQRSHQLPVVVDFWAEWCGPCKMLSPILEKLAARDDGKWVLAKVNTEDYPAPAMQYGVSGIPAVKLFHRGKVIAEFVGAIPESRVNQWLAKVLPSPQQGRIDEANELLTSGRAVKAQQLLWDIVGTEPQNTEAYVLLGHSYIFTDPARAVDLVKNIDDPKFSEQVEMINTLGRLLELRQHPESLPESPMKQKYVGAIKDVHDQQFDAALEKFIDVIRTDRYYDDDGARKACIAIFKYLGEENPITQKHRREFGSALYV